MHLDVAQIFHVEHETAFEQFLGGQRWRIVFLRLLPMGITLVKKSLKVGDLDLLTVKTFDNGVHMTRVLRVLRQKRLNLDIVEQLVFSQTKHLEGLLTGHEATLDP